jgi:hypothetical protein
MVSKKELYATAKKLKSKNCPSLSAMSKQELKSYIDSRNVKKPVMSSKDFDGNDEFVDLANKDRLIRIEKLEKSQEKLVNERQKLVNERQALLVEKNKLKIKIKKMETVKPKPKTVKIKIKKSNMIQKLTPIQEQKPISPIKKMKMKKSLQTAVLAKFNKMKMKKDEKVEEKKNNFQDTSTDGLKYDSKNKLVMWQDSIYKPFSIQQFERMVASYNSHRDGVNNPKLYGMGKNLVKESRRTMVNIKNNLNSEKV